MTMDAPAQREKGWYWVRLGTRWRVAEYEEGLWYCAKWPPGGAEDEADLWDEIGHRILPLTTPANPEPNEAVERVASHDYIIDQARHWLSRIDTRDPDLHRLLRERNIVVTSLDGGHGAFRPDGAFPVEAYPETPKAEANALERARGLLADDPDDMDDA